MTDYELKVPGQRLSSLLGERDGLVGLVEEVLNPVLEAQAGKAVRAGCRKTLQSARRGRIPTFKTPKQIYQHQCVI